MGLTVIIAHYSPAGVGDKFRNILKKTINSIHNQNVDFDVEIIICDDGSDWSKSLAVNKDISEYNVEQIKSSLVLQDLKVEKYLILPDADKYQAIKLKHRAFEIAKYDKIVVLDDDHAFLRKDSLVKFNKYLERYEFVRGRIIGPSGIPKLFWSRNAQGTTYGILKSLYFEFGGFAKFLFENSTGEDVDILWQVYAKLKEKYPTEKKACFAGEIVTKDLASNRWAPRSMKSDFCIIKNSLTINKCEVFNKKFYALYGCNPDRNLSRKKSEWMELPSTESKLSELKYNIIYLLYTPYHIKNFIRRIFVFLVRVYYDKNKLREVIHKYFGAKQEA
ncbi:MAG: glycosyltransferase [Candidatus Helarchaeota archaeon]